MSATTDRPNILLIMADQYRANYFGCAGADFIRTPNLDRLASRGVRFTNCFSNSPHCAPARISLATGMDPARLGALDNNSILQPGQTTYYMRLRDHGYRVGCVGKLDLAKCDRYNGRHGDRPCVFSWGFTHPEEVEGKEHSLHWPTPMGPYGFWLAERGRYEAYYHERKSRNTRARWHMPSELPAETFLDSYQGMRAVEWLRKVPEDFPWHYFVSFSGPHVPHDAPREYVERYANTPMPAPFARPEQGLPQHRAARKDIFAGKPDLVAATRRAYCGYITLIDEWIGRILDTLEERGELDRTFIFFSSDHGEMLGDLGFYGKSLPYEGSLGVPLIASGPGIAHGAMCQALVELSDLNPTICHFAGLPTQPGIDAQSFHSCLETPAGTHRSEIVASHRGWQCVRTERHKLIENYNCEWELYDLQEDPGEQRNQYAEVAEHHPELLADLQRRLKSRLCRSRYGQPRQEL